MSKIASTTRNSKNELSLTLREPLNLDNHNKHMETHNRILQQPSTMREGLARHSDRNFGVLALHFRLEVLKFPQAHFLNQFVELGCLLLWNTARCRLGNVVWRSTLLRKTLLVGARILRQIRVHSAFHGRWRLSALIARGLTHM